MSTVPLTSLRLPVCPISGCPVQDPVVDPDGNTYERAYIVEWVERQGTSPLTRKPLRVDQLVTNRAIKALIDEAMPPASPHRASTASPILTGSNMAAAPPPPHYHSNYQVFVKNLENRTIVLSVVSHSTVFDLKCMIWQQEGVPIEEQRLICAGKEMKEPFENIMNYNVMPNSTIHLVLRLRGG